MMDLMGMSVSKLRRPHVTSTVDVAESPENGDSTPMLLDNCTNEHDPGALRRPHTAASRNRETVQNVATKLESKPKRSLMAEDCESVAEALRWLGHRVRSQLQLAKYLHG